MPNASTAEKKPSKAPNAVVYLAGLVQGVVLVTFPAASGVFTSRTAYALSTSAYGSMFLPQVVVAIVSAVTGAALSQRFGAKRLLQVGLLADLVSMLILVGSQFVENQHALAYMLLLVATGFLGAGFGLTVPAVNALTAALHPNGVDRAALILNALLGVGTVLAPVFVAIFTRLGFWWGLPLLSAVLLTVLSTVTFRLPLAPTGPPPTTADAPRPRFPPGILIFIVAALLYGVVETMNGNWSQVTLTSAFHASPALAPLALTSFWAMVTMGRVVTALIQKHVGARWFYLTLPLVAGAAAALVAVFSATGSGALGIVAFGAAGLGCSALLPLTLSFGEERLRAPGAQVTGILIAAYQVGYGVAAFGVGPLLSRGISLPTLFLATAAIAIILAGTALALTRHPGGAVAARTGTAQNR